MSSVLEFTIDSESHELGRALCVAPDVKVELTPFVPVDGRTVPYIWVEMSDYDTFATEVERSDIVRSLEELDTSGGGRLFRIEWFSQSAPLFRCLGDCDLMVTHGRGDSSTWSFRLLSSTRAAFGTFQSACSEADVPITITRLADEVDRRGAMYRLTDKQREALLTARRLDYYERGNQVTLADVASELGISQQAVGDRLARGVRNLIDSTIK